MKIKRNLIDRKSIESFAEEHELTMVITERILENNSYPILPRFYARFDSSEIKDGSFLISECGNGETEEEAINNYAHRISGKRMVLNAYKDSRTELDVPILIPNRNKI